MENALYERLDLVEKISHKPLPVDSVSASLDTILSLREAILTAIGSKFSTVLQSFEGNRFIDPEISRSVVANINTIREMLGFLFKERLSKKDVYLACNVSRGKNTTFQLKAVKDRSNQYTGIKFPGLDIPKMPESSVQDQPLIAMDAIPAVLKEIASIQDTIRLPVTHAVLSIFQTFEGQKFDAPEENRLLIKKINAIREMVPLQFISSPEGVPVYLVCNISQKKYTTFQLISKSNKEPIYTEKSFPKVNILPDPKDSML